MAPSARSLVHSLRKRFSVASQRKTSSPTRRLLALQRLDDRRVLAAIVVTTVSDVIDANDGETSLREAIVAANATSESDVITFTGTAFNSPTQIELSLGQLDILAPLDLIGPGATELTIDGMSDSRIFNIESDAGSVLLSAMTLINGITQGDNANVGGVVETTQSGGAIRVESSGSVTLRDLTLQNNQTQGARASGGAIFLGGGQTTLENLVLLGNRVNGTFSQGGGIAIDGGVTSIQNTRVSTNTAAGQFGGGGGIRIEGGATVVIEDSTLDGNFTNATSSPGAGIHSEGSGVVIRRSQLTNNRTLQTNSSGGGIAMTGGTLAIDATTIRENQTTNLGSVGGGIFVDSAVLNLEGSLILGNETASVGGHGGGIHAIQTNLSIRNSTFTSNQASAESSSGGGLFLSGGSQATLVHATVTLNSASTDGGGVAIGDSISQLTLHNSIVAVNTANVFAPDISSNLSAIGLDVASSLVGDRRGSGLAESQTPDANGNLIGDLTEGGLIDPLLQPLADNAGLTETHQPQLGSPVIDAANDVLSVGRGGEVLVADQRGLPFSRANGTADMGAFEIQPAQPVAVHWLAPENVLPATILDPTQLNATFDVAGTIVYSPAAGTVLNAGENQTLTATITPDDTVHYVITVVTVEIDVVNPLDYGDAPDSYLTRLDDNGPRHGAATLFLGPSVDIELNAVSSENADSDASDNGVVFATPIIAAEGSTATILLEASEAGKLDAWIDFDGDGVFDPTTEHLSPGSSIDVVAGINPIRLTVPAGVTAGSTFARFRISPDGGLAPTGAAAVGEVEDYAITLLDPATVNDLAFTVTGVRTTLASVGSELVLTIDGDEYFRAPRSAIGEMSITTDEFSNVLIIDQSNSDPAIHPAIPSGGITFDGGDRINTLKLRGVFDSLDFSSTGNIRAQNVDAIDLSDAEIQVVRLDSAAARSMDPDAGGILIVGGAGDRVEFDDTSVWRMVNPEVLAGTLFNTIRLNDAANPSGTFVQTDFGSGWQNIVNPSDVNNDGEVTALDALLIINELARNTYTDPDTGIFVDAKTLDPWPGRYYDQDNGGFASALDALRVINELARQSGSGGNGEGEAATPWSPTPPPSMSSKPEDEFIRDAIFALF